MQRLGIYQQKAEVHELLRDSARECYYLYDQIDNEPIPDNIDLVWAISTPGTALEPASFPANNSIDVYEGTFYNPAVISKAVEIVLKVTALRLKKERSLVTKDDVKSHGPFLLYDREDPNSNGTRFPMQNEHFKSMVDDPNFSIPIDNVIIGHIQAAHSQLKFLN